MSSKAASGMSCKRNWVDATSQPVTKHTRMAKATAGSESHTPSVSGTSSEARQSRQPSVCDEENEENSHGEDTIVIEVDVNGKEKTKKNTKSKATVIDEEDEEDELGMTTLTATGEATEYYL